jgi:hypothetical protein
VPAPVAPHELTTRGGTITSLSATAVTVDGLTCALQHPLDEVKVGDQVYIGCENGILVKIGRMSAAEPEHPAAITKEDPILALSANSITVGPLTCAVGPASPSVSGFKPGDRVGIGCVNGVLAKIVALPPLPSQQPPAAAPAGFATQLGAVAALSSGSISVGPLTCSLGDGSPDVGSYHAGDVVGIGCVNGVLFMIGKLPHASPPVSKPELRHALLARYRACVKAGISVETNGGPTCRIADILRRKAKK